MKITAIRSERVYVSIYEATITPTEEILKQTEVFWQ